ncbi:hypothetical protein NDU88_004808, partial [Pleurodeles waltl]
HTTFPLFPPGCGGSPHGINPVLNLQPNLLFSVYATLRAAFPNSLSWCWQHSSV